MALSGTGLFTPPERDLERRTRRQLQRLCPPPQHRPCRRDRGRHHGRPWPNPAPNSSSRPPGIKSRYVMDKAGILDPDIMCPRIPERPNEQISILAEMAVAAARDALEGRRPQARGHRRRAGRLLQSAARLSRHRHRGAGRARHRGLRLRHERRLLLGHLRPSGRRRHGGRRPCPRHPGVQSGNLFRPSQLPRPRQPFHLRRRRHRLRGRAGEGRARQQRWEIVVDETDDEILQQHPQQFRLPQPRRARGHRRDRQAVRPGGPQGLQGSRADGRPN